MSGSSSLFSELGKVIFLDYNFQNAPASRAHAKKWLLKAPFATLYKCGEIHVFILSFSYLRKPYGHLFLFIFPKTKYLDQENLEQGGWEGFQRCAWQSKKMKEYQAKELLQLMT